MDTLYAAQFSLDDGPGYTGYTSGRRWNGWACPYFTHAEAQRLMIPWNTAPAEAQLSAWYEAATDTYYFLDALNETEPYAVRGEDHRLADGATLHLYPIGHGCWVWDQEA